MTRDEAIAICNERYSRDPNKVADSAINDVDHYVKLGMLKLDEPKSAEERATQKALDALHHAGWDNRVLNVFDRAGLKIVEKDQFNNELNFKTYQP